MEKSSHSTDRILYQLPEGRVSTALLVLCWVAYATAYMGRLNYAATVAEILRVEPYTRAQTGLVASGFFLSYAVGQVLSGWLGDRLPPRAMVAGGLLASGVLNLAMGLSRSAGGMLVLWCVNGLFQSTIWAPILSMLTQWLPASRRQRAYLHIGSTYPVASLASYLLAGGLLRVTSWRPVFFISGSLLLAVAVIWLGAVGRIQRHLQPVSAPPWEGSLGRGSSPTLQIGTVLGLLGLVGGALVCQGVLKDGVGTWIPTFISQVFGTTPSFSTLLTTLLPILNLFGMYLIKYLQTKSQRSEVAVAGLLFFSSAVALLVMYVAGGRWLGLALGVFAWTTTCMMGINTFFITYLPSYFAAYGRVSTVSGLLNFMVYVGSGLSGVGIGHVVDGWGWQVLQLLLVLVAAAGGLLCIAALPFWHRFAKDGPLDETEHKEKASSKGE